MMTSASGSTHGLRKFRDALNAVRRIVGRLPAVQEKVQVDRIAFSGPLARVGDVDTEALLELAVEGHVIEVRAQAGDWSLVVRREGVQLPSVDMTGPVEAAVPGAYVDAMRQAHARLDALEMLQLAQDVAGSVHLILRNDPMAAGAHWIPDVSTLEALLGGTRWAKATRDLATDACVVVVDDLGSMCQSTRGLLFVGPDAQCQLTGAKDESDAEYRGARIAEGWAELPSPFAFQPGASEGAGSDQEKELIRRLEKCLHGAAQLLVWYWLASKAELQANGDVQATFSGARVVTLTMRPGPADSSLDEIGLYEWASIGTDPARREVLQQAMSLALVTPADLATSARPALRTARLLHELAQRGAVAEALATRRAARAGAAESARGAAQAARDAAGKAVERALLQAAAAAGVVLSSAGDLIDRLPAAILLALVALVALGSLVVALRVELPSARGGLSSGLADLAQYRDALSLEEIADIADSQAVKSAQTDLKRAKRTVVIVYAVVALAALAIGGPFVLARSPLKTPAPAPTPHDSPVGIRLEVESAHNHPVTQAHPCLAPLARRQAPRLCLRTAHTL
jgi:hypothetical protein